MRVFRQKISKEEIPEVRNATRKLEVDWDRRWRDALEDKPLASFLSDDPVSGDFVLFFCNSFPLNLLGHIQHWHPQRAN